MTKGRMEAFSDGVVAIIITIMVLELAPPTTAEPAGLLSLTPVFLSYVLSFAFVGIYWNNHHHLLQATKQVNGRVLWANMHLLFWLSLIPFGTAWMGQSHFAPAPVAAYGIILLFAAIAYFVLAHTLIALHGRESRLALALGKDWKGKASVLIYLLAIPLALLRAGAACILYVLVAVMWLIPDRRIERALEQTEK